MRHSKLDPTMNVYTDPKLLDVRGALEALPGLPLSGKHGEGEAAQATWTAGILDSNIHLLAPTLAPTPDNSVQTPSFSDKPFTDGPASKTRPGVAVSADGGKRKHPLTSAVNGCLAVEPTGIEPVTSRMPFHAAPGWNFRKPALSRRYETHHSHLMQHIPRFPTLCVAYVLHREMTARTGDNMLFVNPAQARSCASEPRWGRRKALGLLPARDAALGLLGAFLGMPAVVSWRLSPPRAAATSLKTR
jgi:hypothetical protein